MFDLDELVADCREARSDSQPALAVRDVVRRAVSVPSAVGAALRPVQGGLELLYHDDALTILHVVWAPHMAIYPHDHRMWAVIGIYAGQEDNAFFRRAAPGAATLTETGGKQLFESDVAVLGVDTIHAVHNPRDTLTAAIHVYGGDFVNQARSQWGPGPREERPFDLADARQQFADANAAWAAGPFST
jgi:predicted metal-dependent enzyme (double-stranded beta helix superfamily)